VVVDDGKIIVLGGLIEDSYSADREWIPVLEKIPYVGALFRNLSRTRKRTNLLVFLRPVIMSRHPARRRRIAGRLSTAGSGTAAPAR